MNNNLAMTSLWHSSQCIYNKASIIYTKSLDVIKAFEGVNFAFSKEQGNKDEETVFDATFVLFSD